MKTNSIIHRIDKNNDKINCIVKISLNDECKNGHQDFSITGTFWQVGKNRTDRNMVTAGACHDEIEKYLPELKIFINLHLSDYTGVPMYAVENGFYHLRNGFNDKTKSTKEQFCEYYRVSENQFNELDKTENKLQFALKLRDLGILEQWENEAKKAIAMLEKLTGDEFVVDSKRTQYNAPTDEEIKAEEEKVKTGFYSNAVLPNGVNFR